MTNSLICGAKLHTHVELPHKAGHVVVLKVFGKNLFGKPALIKDMEAGTRLDKKKKRSVH